MEQINISGSTLTHRGKSMDISGAERNDAASFFLHTLGGQIIRFDYADTELNGNSIQSFDDVLALVSEVSTKRPDWLGLEQTLRYADDAALFSKAFAAASDKGFNLFTTTLLNGKSGHAKEGALSFAFSMLGVTWSDEEKDQIN